MRCINKYTSVLVVTILSSILMLNGQSRPFPQNVDYPFGNKPATVTSQEANSTFVAWRNSLVSECNGMYRVEADPADETRVEAIGFGMILTAYFGQKGYFDGLFDYYKSKRTTEAGELMAWLTTCDGIVDRNCATDGDIDVAYALLVAYNQWGGEYLDEARQIVQLIKDHLVVSCGDTILALRPGNGWGGCALTDIMYYTPAYFHLFAELMNDTVWNTLADDTYRIRDASAHPVTGLVPDWQSVGGIPSGNPPQSDRIGYYAYDACRAPWRQALDYIWNGDTLARDWCKKVTDWAYSIGPENIEDGYNLDGSPHNNGYHNSAFVGGFAVGAMCNSQEIADAFGTEFEEMGDAHWFSLSTRSIYLLPVTGNFWKPVLDIVPATGITVNGAGGITEIDINNGVLQLEALITPDSTTITFVDWSITGGTGSASISINGLLTAISDGTVTIRATARDGSELYDEIDITISNQLPDDVSSNISTTEPSLYPNPLSDGKMIHLTGMKQVKFVEIKDITGKKIYTTDQIPGGTIALSAADMNKGYYFFTIYYNDGNQRTIQFIR